MFYITTAIDYTNAAPHIGHAYEKILADVLARYHRLRKQPVYFLTGVDQHGQKVQQSAQKSGIDPQVFVEQCTKQFKALYKKLGISYDAWAATTDPKHKTAVQAILTALHNKGQIYKAKYEGFYSVRQEQFLTDKERDESGNFGPEWGEVVFLEEENYYFKLAEHRDWLLAFLQKNPQFIIPSFRAADALNAAQRITGDLCISRPKARLAWGIELPFDPQYVSYVWFDALINYVSFAGYDGSCRGKTSARVDGLPDFQELWPPKVQVLGKDILVPAHGIYWPTMLHAMGFADDEIPQLLVHGWWNIRGEKMSKSVGNIIDPNLLADRYGADALRYYLTREMVIGQDADFSEERLRQRYNSDLANDLGNLLNRSLNMAQRYRDGVLTNVEQLDEIASLRALILENTKAYQQSMEHYQIHAAMEALWKIISAANSLVEATAPWKLAKEKDDPAIQARDQAQLDAVLYALVETVRIVTLLVSPVLPSASQQMLEQLNFSPAQDVDIIEQAAWGGLKTGHRINAPKPVFPRLEPTADA